MLYTWKKNDFFFHPLRNASIPRAPVAKFSGSKQELWLSHEFYDLSELNNVYFSLAGS